MEHDERDVPHVAACFECFKESSRLYYKDKNDLDRVIANIGIVGVLQHLQELTCTTSVTEMLKVYYAQLKFKKES